MISARETWPDQSKLGWPKNPDRDGSHVMEWANGRQFHVQWVASWKGYNGFNAKGWENWRYVGPALTYKQIEALVPGAARVMLADLGLPNPAPMCVTYQGRVNSWMIDCFGLAITTDTRERNYRFLEEALELVQSLGCTKYDAIRLVEYVFGRLAGEPGQEVGGTEVTLAALCTAAGLYKQAEAERELARVNTPEMKEKIRAKHAAKDIRSPLPGIVP